MENKQTLHTVDSLAASTLYLLSSVLSCALIDSLFVDVFECHRQLVKNIRKKYLRGQV